MGKDVNLNSEEWTDLVFEGKNKKYGAYFLRRTSSKRHIVAFLVVLVFTGAISALPALIEAVKPKNQNLGGIDDSFELADLKQAEEIPEEDIIKQEMAPPPPPLKATIQFTPPVITDDEKVTDEDEMKSQEELKDTKEQISIATVEGSTDKNAVDIADLREHKQIVQEEVVEKPFTSVEQMPQYPGGTAELNKFIASNLRYPTIAAENGIEGRVTLRFVVDKDGNVSDVQVLRGLDSSCDNEAIRVVKSMPKWIPGKQNGRAVPVYFTLPIVFRLQK